MCNTVPSTWLALLHYFISCYLKFSAHIQSLSLYRSKQIINRLVFDICFEEFNCTFNKPDNINEKYEYKMTFWKRNGKEDMMT
jgi:hypothetical protein